MVKGIGLVGPAESFLERWDFDRNVEEFRSGGVVDVPELVAGTP